MGYSRAVVALAGAGLQWLQPEPALSYLSLFFLSVNKAFEAIQGKHCESREREEGFQKPGVGADLKKGKKYFLLRFQDLHCCALTKCVVPFFAAPCCIFTPALVKYRYKIFICFRFQIKISSPSFPPNLLELLRIRLVSKLFLMSKTYRVPFSWFLCLVVNLCNLPYFNFFYELIVSSYFQISGSVFLVFKCWWHESVREHTMTFLTSWEDFEQAAERMYLQVK